jgi:hypothetical protein
MPRSVYFLLALLALAAIVVSFHPRFEVLHKVGSVLLAVDLAVYFADR